MLPRRRPPRRHRDRPPAQGPRLLPEQHIDRGHREHPCPRRPYGGERSPPEDLQGTDLRPPRCAPDHLPPRTVEASPVPEVLFRVARPCRGRTDRGGPGGGGPPVPGAPRPRPLPGPRPPPRGGARLAVLRG